ncbi:type I restriction enzyme M protein [Cereibacter ovatus]|uniref:Type I restriction enzyme M protein n=1 Tax=Cereibacter ovatus TaxID=439529 RepID=A0A285D5A3_9RHOB|nr:N-6 DNA methylase [Cereibacter ovatus]SNX74982.1 type I restriction enzyme M protein [Cereibacter ovatus]
MAATKKPKTAPTTPWPATPESLHTDGDWIWIPLKGEWRDSTGKPEELVRQKFVRHLCENYGYSLDQMRQEQRMISGSRSARADIVIWETAAKANAGPGVSPVLVIECKAESVEINLRDYYQGESYTRSAACEFFITTNNRFTAIFKLVPGAPGDFVQINEIPKASDWGDAKRLEEIRSKLRVFNRKEFQDLLFKCHSILRDVHKMDPGRAFDTISKILFVKMYVERSGLHGTFTVDFLDRRASTRLPTDPEVHDGLFEQTKAYYKADDLFTAADRLEISEATFRRLVKELERFDLSKTSDDIKGLAFEKFLGNTFRGELGQFFTPRPVVDFMVSLLDPQEGELICDPASGSGGFLIRAFEHVRGLVAADIQKEKDKAQAEIEAKKLPIEEEERLIDEAFARLNRELLPSDDNNKPIDTRVGRLAWNCVFGCDAEPRAARTAKMNMIMHGDGHGGIHYHDGLVDINGIFPGRFDIIITNPPFGSNVGDDQKVGGSEETRVPTDDAYVNRCESRYGEPWRESHAAIQKAMGSKILDLYEIGKGKKNRATEIVFVERCLKLLKPGGRMGIVLPDGNLNNPSLTWLRRWCEGKARILAVVSLPEETFSSAKATVKASLVFVRRFTEADETAWEAAWATAHATHDAAFNAKRDAICADIGRKVITVEDDEIEGILADLSKLGIERCLPEWRAGPEPDYPRGIGATKVGKPTWKGTAKDAKKATQLKRDYGAAFDTAKQKQSDAFWRDLTAGLRAIDAAQDAALWATVREVFDYPVFVAAPKTVGITSTGDTGETVPNELPALLEAYRSFETWVEAGADPAQIPGFLLPSAA